MGNFYANLAVRSADTDAVAAALESHARNAYVATVDDTTFVYDERCDEQDLDELRVLARTLARDLHLPVLAVCNHDDDVLWIALAEGKYVVDVYDSYPGYFEGGSNQPKLTKLDRLCDAFGVAARDRVDALLLTPHADMGFEVERHRALMSILGMSPEAATLGYRYVSQGELGSAVPAAVIMHVGGAASSDEDDEAAFDGPVIPSPALLARSPVSGLDINEAMCALALSEVGIPEHAIGIFGAPRMSGLAAFSRLQQYLAAHGRMEVRGPGDMVVHTDAACERLLGASEVPFVEVVTRLVDALGVWPSLSEADRQAIKAKDPAIQRRVAEAMLRFTSK